MELGGRYVVFVSGVSTEIGAKICKRLVGYGLIVVGCGPADVIDDLAEDIRIKFKGSSGEMHAIRCNLSNEIDILAMFHRIRSRFGRIDVCVNIVGFSSTSVFRECDGSHLRNTLQENIMAVSICTRESLQLMKENNIKGQIIQVIQIHSLDSAHMMALNPTDSNMCKGAKNMICAYGKALAKELIAQHSEIYVSTVCPYVTQTKPVFGKKSEEDFETVYYSGMHAPEKYADSVIHILKMSTRKILKDIILLP